MQISLNEAGSIMPASSFMDYWVTSDGILHFETTSDFYNVTDTTINQNNTTADNFCTMPVDYRPVSASTNGIIRVPVHAVWTGQTDGSAGWYIKIDTTGALYLENQSGTSRTVTFLYGWRGYYPLF
jgi:hypothetical protein